MSGRDEAREPGDEPGRPDPHGFSPWHLLLLLPLPALLWLPFYDHAEPLLWGFPFFYWYQFLWVGISAAITALVYLVTEG